MNLPQPIAEALVPLFEALPPDRAMSQLVVRDPALADLVDLVIRATHCAAIAEAPALIAGLWLYVDDLDRSHAVSQSMSCATGAFWHGIMHRREGDFGNSHYWFNRAGAHPAMARVSNYSGHAFIDEVAHYFAQNPEPLVQHQREEWRALFQWCAEQTGIS